MKIRLDDVMQSLSFPLNAVYYYYIPLETVLMFMDGMIFGKAVYGISSEEDVLRHGEDFIKLPDIGDEGRRKVMTALLTRSGMTGPKKSCMARSQAGSVRSRPHSGNSIGSWTGITTGRVCTRSFQGNGVKRRVWN